MLWNMPRRTLFLRLNDKAKAEVVAFMHEATLKYTFRTRRRGNAVLLSSQGWTMKQISRQFKVSTRTVREWFHRFREKGATGLADPPRPCSLTPEQETQLFKTSQRARLLKKTHRRIEKLPSYQQLTQWVKQQYGIRLSVMQINRIVRRKLREPG